MTENILFTHDEEYKQNLNRLLDILPNAEKETLIQTLTRVVITKTASPLETPAFQGIVDDFLERNVQYYFIDDVAWCLEHPEGLLSLKICERLGIGNPNLYLNAWRKLIAHPGASVRDLSNMAKDLEKLGKPALVVEAWEKVIAHPDASVGDLSNAAEKFEKFGKPALAIETWEKVIANPDARGSALYSVAQSFKRLGKPDLAIQAWQKVRAHPGASASQI